MQFFSQATQQSSKHERIQAGTISRINLVNFMSHANFSADFSRGLNFVVGQNGAGKSALLVAVCTAFGLSARATHRTEDGAKGLVKEGTNSSTITLRLTNEGPDAFRPDEYGHEVVIERTITAAVRCPPGA